uniref:NECAP PHear domain-containing protein n=1 Tax=Timema poppense TaxID=170557 RepID=A0A7R9DFU1_TIMPO|nr:unnamed protein product [Timema poppensis]
MAQGISLMAWTVTTETGINAVTSIFALSTGRSAFIGVGFSDRSDSFDLNVALQDHFKWLKKSEEIEKEKDDPKQELDLRFKEGETIKINMKITKKDGSDVSSKPRARPGLSLGSGILPPPPGGVKLAGLPSASGVSRVTPTSSPSHQPSSNVDLLLDVDQPAATPLKGPGGESWGEFARGGQHSDAVDSSASSNWVQF